MIVRRSTQSNELDRLPKNSLALQERMETIKRTTADQQPLTPRPPLENPTDLDKDDTFFLL